MGKTNIHEKYGKKTTNTEFQAHKLIEGRVAYKADRRPRSEIATGGSVIFPRSKHFLRQAAKTSAPADEELVSFFVLSSRIERK